ncbi:MAG: TetR/AcrR family transcriptional regulator [Deltaproteobacteria bacterium]|nr:TetR/AcrR family transcriptional regulator [Deltaproteobacteria bacterium]
MDPKERREMILDKAKKLFAEKGYHQTQISDIIREAGIARGTIYQYFKNKDDLFVRLLEKYYEKWESTVSLERDMNLAAVDPVDYFRLRIHRTLEFFAGDPDISRIYLRMGLGLHQELEAVIKKFEERIMDMIAADLSLGIRNGHVRPDLDLALAANLLAGALLRTAYYYFGTGREPPRDLEEASRKISAILSPGIFNPA